MYELTVVLPAFNEESNIEAAIRRAADAIAPLVKDRYEILVVNDGSSDQTADIIEKLQDEYGDHLRMEGWSENRGYGAALRLGFEKARGKYIFYTDADNQFDLTELEAFLPHLEEWDAVIGYRQGRQDAGFRKIVSRGYNLLASTAFGIQLTDVNCSFKVFHGPYLKQLALQSDDFFIDTEIMLLFHRAGHRFLQRGVTHYPRTAGQSTVRPSDVPRTFLTLAKTWFRLRREPRRADAGA